VNMTRVITGSSVQQLSSRQGRVLAYYVYTTTYWWWWVLISVGVLVMLFAAIWAYGRRRRRMAAIALQQQQQAAVGAAHTAQYTAAQPYTYTSPYTVQQQQTTGTSVPAPSQPYQAPNVTSVLQPDDPGEYTYNAETGEYTYVGPSTATGVPPPAGYPQTWK